MVRGIVIGLVAALLATAPAHARERAPGAPGGKADWASADKQGFGTAASRDSRVWFTLREADMTEVHYPDLSPPLGAPSGLHGRRQARHHGHGHQRHADLHADVGDHATGG